LAAHGAKTASGQIYDLYALTAAHASLPLLKRVKVKILTTGRCVVVTINDRPDDSNVLIKPWELGIGNWDRALLLCTNFRRDWDRRPSLLGASLLPYAELRELEMSIKRCPNLKIFGPRKNNQVLAPNSNTQN
jgi:hypothetical protein